MAINIINKITSAEGLRAWYINFGKDTKRWNRASWRVQDNKDQIIEELDAPFADKDLSNTYNNGWEVVYDIIDKVLDLENLVEDQLSYYITDYEALIQEYYDEI